MCLKITWICKIRSKSLSASQIEDMLSVIRTGYATVRMTTFDFKTFNFSQVIIQIKFM